jgi:hypothetical protein
MNVNQAFTDAINAKVPDKTKTVAQVVAELTQRNIDNPITSAPQVYAPFNFSSIAALVSSVSMAKLVNYIHFNQVVFDIRAADRMATGLWAQALAAAEYMTADEATAIVSLLSSSIPDPNWTAQISWSEQEFGCQLTEADIRGCNLGFAE